MLRIASNSEGCRSPSSSENINISKKKGNLQNILNVDYFPSCSLVQGGKYSKLRVCTRCGTWKFFSSNFTNFVKFQSFLHQSGREVEVSKIHLQVSWKSTAQSCAHALRKVLSPGYWLLGWEVATSQLLPFAQLISGIVLSLWEERFL